MRFLKWLIFPRYADEQWLMDPRASEVSEEAAWKMLESILTANRSTGYPYRTEKNQSTDWPLRTGYF